MTNACVSGKFQSPISIRTKSAIRCGALCDLVFYYRTSKCNMVNVNKNFVIDYDNGSYVLYNSEVFELDKIAFTHSASHKIDNYTFPLEIMLYHRAPDSGKVLVISVMSDVNDAVSRSKMFLEIMVNQMPRNTGEQKKLNTADSWNIFDIIPETKSFFTYEGSLIQSPCSENVTWVVFDNSINCSSNFFDSLRSVVESNARSIKKTNGRRVYYNINTAEKNKKNYGDRIRCYNEKQFRKECAKLTSHTDIVDARNKQLLLILIAVSIVTILILVILYLAQKDFFGKGGTAIKDFFTTKIFLPVAKGAQKAAESS